MLSGDGYVQDSALLILGKPGVHYATAPHLFQATKGFDFPRFQHQDVIRQMLNLIQRVADVQHRDIDFARQTLQIGQ